MKTNGFDQLAVMILSGALGVLGVALLFDGDLRQLLTYGAALAFLCGLGIGALHLLTGR